ncbi:unnamed protein product [Lactuca virosa]|uniref:Uncharacterized protein n=1 Tax=Lactuca virosa TaxID=75947 RepID=A0AAU9N246_9ASTR|nr:unnamed protein product [Lactuca virosa]
MVCQHFIQESQAILLFQHLFLRGTLARWKKNAPRFVDCWSIIHKERQSCMHLFHCNGGEPISVSVTEFSSSWFADLFICSPIHCWQMIWLKPAIRGG